MRTLTKLTTLLTVAGIWAGLTASATIMWTAPLNLATSDNVVGAVQILQGDPASGTAATEAFFAQKLLDLAADQSKIINHRWYGTGKVNYDGIISLDGAQKSEGDGVNVPGGWQFAMAKYDGQNAGYVLFYLNGEDAILPQTSADIWVNGQNQGYGISGFTLFNPVVPEPSTVLAGLMLLIPFGASAIRLLRSRK